MRKFGIFSIIAITMSFWLFQPFSFGRGGGGHSFSGGGSHSSGGSSHSYSGSGYSSGLGYSSSSSGSSGFLFLIILIVVIYFLLQSKYGDKKVSSLDELNLNFGHNAVNSDQVNTGLKSLVKEDPDFSLPLFNDFCFALYSTLHHARGGGSATLTPYMGYLSDISFKQLLGLQNPTQGLHPIIGVVIGSFQISAIEFWEKQVEIRFMVDANYTEDLGNGNQRSFYAREIWVLNRNRGVKSRVQKNARNIQCPSCGSPAKSDLHGKCPACNQLIRSGVYDWFVQNINVIEISNRPPLLTTTVQEEGTDLPTIIDPALNEHIEQAKTILGLQDFNALSERTRQIFFQLQRCWSLRDLRMIRPFESDSIFETHLYWIEEYKKQKLINRLEEVGIQNIELCKIFLDAHFVSLTVRIHASVKDWTESEDGKTICGSKYNPRAFTEYWTLIRSINFKETKGGFNECPACGAPLKISQAGDCEYCHSKVTSGEFDWILSSIEQDESYRG